MLKKLILMSVVCAAFGVSGAFAAEQPSNEESPESITVALTAQGRQDITLGTIVSPPGFGALKRAQRNAKKNLKIKCAELGGTIVGEITYETLRFDEGIMAAIVEASGNCEIDKE